MEAEVPTTHKNRNTGIDKGRSLTFVLGRITKLHPGADEIVSLVDVKVRNGEVRRAVNRICALPLE